MFPSFDSRPISDLSTAHSCHVQPTKFCSVHSALCGSGFFHGCRPSVENVEDVDLPGPWGWRGPQANRSDHATISNLKQDPILGMSQWTFPLGLSARHRYYQWTLDNGQWLRPTRLPPTPRNRRQITTTQTLAWPQRDMSACVRLRRPWHRWHRCNRHKPGFPRPRSPRSGEAGQPSPSSSSSNGDPITHRRASPCSPRPLRQRTLDRAPWPSSRPKHNRQETWLTALTQVPSTQSNPRGSGARPPLHSAANVEAVPGVNGGQRQIETGGCWPPDLSLAAVHRRRARQTVRPPTISLRITNGGRGPIPAPDSRYCFALRVAVAADLACVDAYLGRFWRHPLPGSFRVVSCLGETESCARSVISGS